MHALGILFYIYIICLYIISAQHIPCRSVGSISKINLPYNNIYSYYSSNKIYALFSKDCIVGEGTNSNDNCFISLKYIELEESSDNNWIDININNNIYNFKYSGNTVVHSSKTDGRDSSLIYLFGGIYNAIFSNTLYTLGPADLGYYTFSKVEIKNKVLPPPLAQTSLHHYATTEGVDVLLLHGGYNLQYYNNDIYFFILKDGVYKKVSRSDDWPILSTVGSTSIIDNNKLYIFGGEYKDIYTNSLYILTLPTTNKELEDSSNYKFKTVSISKSMISPRSYSNLYISEYKDNIADVNNELVILGGCSIISPSNKNANNYGSLYYNNIRYCDNNLYAINLHNYSDINIVPIKNSKLLVPRYKSTIVSDESNKLHYIIGGTIYSNSNTNNSNNDIVFINDDAICNDESCSASSTTRSGHYNPLTGECVGDNNTNKKKPINKKKSSSNNIITPMANNNEVSNSKNCLANCYNHGTCINGICKCNFPYGGIDCHYITCQVKLLTHGVCVNSNCVCTPGYNGNRCEQPIKCINDCSKQGICVAGTCACEPGYAGDDCSTVSVPDNHNNTCSNECEKNGYCFMGRCLCPRGYTGPDCDIEIPDYCNPKCVNGHCQYGKCFCAKGYSGPDCSKTGSFIELQQSEGASSLMPDVNHSLTFIFVVFIIVAIVVISSTVGLYIAFFKSAKKSDAITNQKPRFAPL